MACRRGLNSIAVALLCAALGFACGSDEGGQDAGAATDAAPPINFTFEDLVQACVRLAACDVDRKPEIQECIKNFYDRLAALGQQELYERLYHCANQGKGDCKIIRNCLGFAGRPQDMECNATFAARCDGDVAWNCDIRVSGEGWAQGLDCSKGGLKCGLKSTGTTVAAICGDGECNKTLFEPICQDKKLLKCVGGAVEINDCPAQSLQCRDPAVENCEGTGRSCQQMSPTCQGTTLVDCVYGYLKQVDCAALPGQKKCDNALGQCVGAGGECGVMETFFNTCEGDTLVVCVDRFKRRFNCKEMGFEGCEIATTGYGAYCKAAPVYE